MNIFTKSSFSNYLIFYLEYWEGNYYAYFCFSIRFNFVGLMLMFACGIFTSFFFLDPYSGG